MDGVAKRIVYVIRSDSDPSRHYVGITSNVHDRLEWHNHSVVAGYLDGIRHQIRDGLPLLATQPSD